MCKEIKLTQDKYALVRGKDYERITLHKWYAVRSEGQWYAIRNVGKRPFRRHILMHHEIMNARKGQEIDHINGDTLDNRKSNLRISTANNRFWSYVEKTNKCWLWTRGARKGYGAFFFDGRMQEAHRVSWIISNGRIPDGLCVLHKCDTPLCVRPDHLFIGTKKDNSMDMAT